MSSRKSYKIQIGEHTLFIVDRVCSFSFGGIGVSKALIHRYSNAFHMEGFLGAIKSSGLKYHFIVCDDVKTAFGHFAQAYKFIEAAGGLVLNERNEVLFILRNGKWDLPKGKIERGETREIAAIREVEEECGLNISKLEDHLSTTYHTYALESQKILKANYWYLMKAGSNQKLIPQMEEGIERVEWVAVKDIPNLLENSFDSIRDVLLAYERIEKIKFLDQ